MQNVNGLFEQQQRGPWVEQWRMPEMAWVEGVQAGTRTTGNFDGGWAGSNQCMSKIILDAGLRVDCSRHRFKCDARAKIHARKDVDSDQAGKPCK